MGAPSREWTPSSVCHLPGSAALPLPRVEASGLRCVAAHLTSAGKIATGTGLLSGTAGPRIRLHWTGAAAEAAVAEAGTLGGRGREVVSDLPRGAAALLSYAAAVDRVRARVAGLQRSWDAELVAHRARLLSANDPPARLAVDEATATEQQRLRRLHTAASSELAADAGLAATRLRSITRARFVDPDPRRIAGQLLSDLPVVRGVAHDRDMAALAPQAAGLLAGNGQPLDAAARDQFLTTYGRYAGDPVFAAYLLAALGPDRLSQLTINGGSDDSGPADQLRAFLGSALLSQWSPEALRDMDPGTRQRFAALQPPFTRGAALARWLGERSADPGGGNSFGSHKTGGWVIAQLLSAGAQQHPTWRLSPDSAGDLLLGQAGAERRGVTSRDAGGRPWTDVPGSPQVRQDPMAVFLSLVPAERDVIRRLLLTPVAGGVPSSLIGHLQAGRFGAGGITEDLSLPADAEVARLLALAAHDPTDRASMQLAAEAVQGYGARTGITDLSLVHNPYATALAFEMVAILGEHPDSLDAAIKGRSTTGVTSRNGVFLPGFGTRATMRNVVGGIAAVDPGTSSPPAGLTPAEQLSAATYRTRIPAMFVFDPDGKPSRAAVGVGGDLGQTEGFIQGMVARQRVAQAGAGDVDRNLAFLAVRVGVDFIPVPAVKAIAPKLTKYLTPRDSTPAAEAAAQGAEAHRILQIRGLFESHLHDPAHWQEGASPIPWATRSGDQTNLAILREAQRTGVATPAAHRLIDLWLEEEHVADEWVSGTSNDFDLSYRTTLEEGSN